MSRIPKEVIEKIKEAATITDVITQFQSETPKNSGSSKLYKCTICEGEHKLSVRPTKNIAKCFKCDDKAMSPVDYLTVRQNMSYPEALEWLGKHYGVDLELPLPARKKKSKKNEKTFRDQQLIDSGLVEKDIVHIQQLDDNTEKEVMAMTSGALDDHFKIIPGNDMIIHFLDLDGKPIIVRRKDKKGKEYGSEFPLMRVRHRVPSANPDRYGNPAKYKSPPGTGTHLYYPQNLRNAVQQKRNINTLFIQEGEKKAEKAAKHGLFSVGVMGIHNLAQGGNKLHKDFERIVDTCNVQNVVFVLDSDWQEISDKPDVSILQRPNSFYYAIQKYRDYFRSFDFLEIYFGHVKPVEGAKGLDDLLAGPLAEKEDLLKADFNKLIKTPTDNSKWVGLFRITQDTTYKIKQHWKLNSYDEFVALHGDKLADWPYFYIKRLKYRWQDGKHVLDQPILENEIFYEKIDGKNGYYYKFNYYRAYLFLSNRGFGKYKLSQDQSVTIHKDGNIISEVNSDAVIEFVTEFCEQLDDHEKILNMLYQTPTRFLGPESLNRLKPTEPELARSSQSLHYMYFKNEYWKITEDGIDVKPLTDIEGGVWKEKIIPHEVKLIKEPLAKYEIINYGMAKDLAADYGLEPEEMVGEYAASHNPSKCEFQKFINCTSNFSWNKLHPTGKQLMDNSRHELNKITAIGYMLHTFFDPARAKAVVAMDGTLVASNEANGRSGKSIVGEALGIVNNTAFLNGKKFEKDNYPFEEITANTDTVFLDDVQRKFDFEAMFPSITGRFQVEKKGVGKFTIPREDTPKMYITTNYSIFGDTASFTDRQHIIAFSNFFNENHSVVDEIGHRLFDDWGQEQWNLYFNFLAYCLVEYFRHGLVQAPQADIKRRKLRQLMGEEFLMWADEIYTEERLGERLDRKHLYGGPKHQDSKEFESFYTAYPKAWGWTKPTAFSKKLKAYAEYNGYTFNPGIPVKKDDAVVAQHGGMDKSSSVEYYNLEKI